MKRILFPAGAVLVLLFIFFFRYSVFAKMPSAVISDRVIIRFHDTVSGQSQDESLKGISVLKKEKLRLHNSVVISIPGGSAESVAARLNKDPRVQYAEKDQVAKAFEIPNDQYYSYQWGLQKIHADRAWDTTHGSASALIAIVDTGIDGMHPDLASKIAARANFTTDSDIDDNGHGSHVAGIAAAETNNSIGVAGMGYNTRLLSVKVLDSSGSGYYSWVANGIIWAADNGAKVINLSLGGPYPSSLLQDAVNYAWNKGVVVVAAAGNSNSTAASYPAYYANAISVAATDSNDARAYFSNYGKWVDLSAPGVSILSTYQGGYAYLSGTSMATPFVSGLAGLVIGEHADWTNTQVKNKIEQSADAITGTGILWKYGRIDACAAVDCTGTASVTPTPILTPTPTPTTTFAPTDTPTVTPMPTAVASPTNTPSPSLTPTPVPSTPTPTSSKPWWCVYAPWYYLCK